MLQVGKDEKAKYPFLPEAGKFLQDQGFSLAEFGTDPVLKVIVDKAYERIMAATRGSVYRSALVGGKATGDHTLNMEIFSFLIAIVLIKLANHNTLVQRFALNESRRAEAFLTGDLSDTQDRSRSDMARRIIHDVSGTQVVQSNHRYLIPVADYLIHSKSFHEREWKLVNREVDGGYIILKPDKAVRLVRHTLVTYITSRINKSPVPEMIPGFEVMVAQLVAEAERLTPKYVVTGVNPPCVEHAIKVLEGGENLPHSGRFMLATFLLSRGKPIAEIAPLFRNAPDYNERITMYQLKHLAGEKTGTKYMCPSCSKLRIQGLCFATEECAGITNPLQFGRRRMAAGDAAAQEAAGR